MPLELSRKDQIPLWDLKGKAEKKDGQKKTDRKYGQKDGQNKDGQKRWTLKRRIRLLLLLPSFISNVG